MHNLVYGHENHAKVACRLAHWPKVSPVRDIPAHYIRT